MTDQEGPVERSLDYLTARLTEAELRIDKLVGALEQVEWIEFDSGPGEVTMVCAWCEGWQPKHEPGCIRQAALADRRRESVTSQSRPRTDSAQQDPTGGDDAPQR